MKDENPLGEVSDVDQPEQQEGSIYDGIKTPDEPKEYGKPLILRVIKYLIYGDMLKRAHAQTFFNHHEHLMSEELRRDFMEKYGVQTDPKKVEDAKKKAQGEKTAGANDPNVNVPKDPDKGTEPYERDPENGQG